MNRAILYLIVLAECIFAGRALYADVLYCNPANVGVANGQTKATGYKTLWSAMSAMAPGDTIVIASGDWRNTNGMYINNYYRPPNGLADNYTKLTAENDWETKLPYMSITASTSNPVSYMEFRGIVFDNKYIGVGLQNYFVFCNHIKIIRCGFLVHGASGNAAAFGFLNNVLNDPSLNEYNLMEECIVWGSGRYMILSWMGQRNIFRRTVVRHDKNVDGAQIFNFRGYGTIDSAWQNCISIDSDRTEYYTSPMNAESGGFWPGDMYRGDGNIVEGSISIKDVGMAYYLSGREGTSDLSTIKNSVAMDTKWGVGISEEMSGSFRFQKVNVEANNLLAYKTNYSGMDGITFYNYGGYATVKDSIIKDIESQGYGLMVSNAQNINHYNAGLLFSPPNWGTNSVSYDPSGNGLLYPVRIESDSALSTAGSDGGPIGPTIIKKIGRSGTLYGEAGWNELTNENLWPFPNESKIKELMSQTVDGVSGLYGFTAYESPFSSPNTLTTYIWEYLGNKIPDEIYNTTVPNAPKMLRIIK